MVDDIEHGTSATEPTASATGTADPVTLDVAAQEAPVSGPDATVAPAAPEDAASDNKATGVEPGALQTVAGPVDEPVATPGSPSKAGNRRKKDASQTASAAKPVDVVPVAAVIPVRRRATPAKTGGTGQSAPIGPDVSGTTAGTAKPASKPKGAAVKESKPAEPVAVKPAKDTVLAVAAAKAPAPKPRVTPAQGTKPTTPAAAPTPPVRNATASTKENIIMTATTEFSEKFQTAFKEASEKAKAAFEKSQASFGDIGEFAKGNVEALVESSKILSTGLQELGKGYVTEGKSAFETLTAEFKDLAAAKSPTEFFEKQSSLLRKHFDAAVAVSSKNSEAVLKLANEAFQPISNRVSLAVEKIKQAA